MEAQERITLINHWVDRIEVSRTEVIISCRRTQLLTNLIHGTQDVPDQENTHSDQPLVLKATVQLQRSGIETKLVYPSGPSPTVHARSLKALQKSLLKSLQWNEALVCGEVRSIDALIERDNLNPRQVHRLRKLAFLAPDIMDRIIAGDVPDSLTLERLKKDFPLDWPAQRKHFGLKSSLH